MNVLDHYMFILTFFRAIIYFFLRPFGLVCPLHKCALESGMILVQQGLARKSPEYLEARKTFFPMADSSLVRLALDQSFQKRMKFCRLCRACEEKWIEEHRIDWMSRFEAPGSQSDSSS